MTYRFYVADTLGDGVSRQTAFRSKVSDHIGVGDESTHFWDWSNRAWPKRFCLASCDSTLHQEIAADPGIVAGSPELADVSDIDPWLDGQAGTLPPALAAAIEAGGIPLQWVTAATTRREIWQFIAEWHFMMQRFKGGDQLAFAFMKHGLDVPISSVPANVRNRISQWMTQRGLDASWITGATLVREVVTFIIQNQNFPIMPLGPVSFANG